jgi:Rad3-related DNA helicase
LFQGYERWTALLTDAQKEFVSTPLHAPHRIEGPAGTGKTISLILKAITALHGSEKQSTPYKALLVTHSEATRRTIEQVIEANDPWSYLRKDSLMNLQTLKLATLQQLCGELLNREISESEFLDRDALESKQYQVLFISEALSSTMKEDYPTHKKFLSPEFGEFLTTTDAWVLAEMFQHEISVVIKGRADEQLESFQS